MACNSYLAPSPEQSLEAEAEEVTEPQDGELREASRNETTTEMHSKPRGQLATMKLNDTKAGMEGLDTDKINQIIEEASRGSKFYNHKKQRQEKIDERIRRMLELKDSFTPEQIARAEAQMDALTAHLEQSRDLSRFIVHVDMDAFYAAVEMRDRPELRDVPMAVGSNSMLSTSNYAARKFGVRAAMPGFIGRKLCPQLVIVPCDFDKYRAASQLVQQVMARYDPDFSMVSLDEGYLDITDRVATEMDGDTGDQSEDEVAQRLVREMRAEICRLTRLTASAGIAANGMLAKICSDQNKPDGQFFLPRERRAVLDFLRELPVRKVSGIGNVLSQQLAALEVTRCGELLERRGLVRLLFSECAQLSLLRAGLGADPPGVGRDEDSHQKSVSTETTFAATADPAQLSELLGELCQQLSEDLRRKGLRGRTVTLKLKTSSFVVRSRATTLAEPTSAAAALLSATRPALARELAAGEPLRLLGVRASALVAAEVAAGRRQATLTEMTGRAAAPRHECPVCGRTAGSLAELSAHVEQCLDGEAGGGGEQSEGRPTGTDDCAAESESGNGGAIETSGGDAAECGPTKEETVLSVGSPQPSSCDNVSEDPISHAPANGISDPAACVGPSSASDGDRLQLGNVEDTTPASAAETACGGPSAASCPVCGRPMPEELELINRHLDECLNQKLLSRLTDGGPVGGQKRPPAPHSGLPRTKHKRIDSFFTAVKRS
ncbi:DNA polymerase kappa-like isoform X2 [Amphibalanus amphitrite]|nr:DNA polymerase kappa-like isoform X2 [Amphibalanus amphitrite]XP_043191022.1 DNA polymerase kappa-like isoform X2 [Amphibalanus amphitrite]XP_043191023.1 DNA polymerase kappa-like isoform X2 [Amphibalanus amphitrite]